MGKKSRERRGSMLSKQGTLFEFSATGYLYYGALCTYIEDQNKILVIGIRVKRGKTVEDVFVDDASSFIDLTDNYGFNDYKLYTHEDNFDDLDALITMAESVFSLSLLNCRNILLVDQEPDVTISRQYQQQFGIPLIRYKTLAIGAPSKSYSSAEPKEYQGLMPLHLRRGNFATYTDDKPLFGKYTGTFWRPATAVGEVKNGVVIKDYEVQP